jgi:hypothetical protein
MARAKRLLWFDLPMHREPPWPVYIVEEIPGDLVGLADYGERCILIAAWQPKREIGETMIHEALHAFGGEHPTTNDDHAEASLSAAEEHFILRAEKRAHYSLRKMGLRLPDLPRGFDAMRARALAAREAR